MYHFFDLFSAQKIFSKTYVTLFLWRTLYSISYRIPTRIYEYSIILRSLNTYEGLLCREVDPNTLYTV